MSGECGDGLLPHGSHHAAANLTTGGPLAKGEGRPREGNGGEGGEGDAAARKGGSAQRTQVERARQAEETRSVMRDANGGHSSSTPA